MKKTKGAAANRQALKLHHQLEEEQLREVKARLLKPVSTDLTVARTLRFAGTLAGGNTNLTFTWTNLINTICVATTATALTCLFEYVKIKRISARAWANGSNAAANTYTVTLRYGLGDAGALMNDNRSRSNTGMGMDPTYVTLTPRLGSQAANWQTGGAGEAFSLFVEQLQPGGGNETAVILDVEVLFRTNDVTTVIAAVNAGAALTPGEWYYRGLDSLAYASTAWPPVGVSNTA